MLVDNIVFMSFYSYFSLLSVVFVRVITLLFTRRRRTRSTLNSKPGDLVPTSPTNASYQSQPKHERCMSMILYCYFSLLYAIFIKHSENIFIFSMFCDQSLELKHLFKNSYTRLYIKTQ